MLEHLSGVGRPAQNHCDRCRIDGMRVKPAQQVAVLDEQPPGRQRTQPVEIVLNDQKVGRFAVSFQGRAPRRPKAR